MTIQEAKDKLIRWCDSQIGYHEGPNNFNQYADVDGIRKLYGWYPQNQPWCDIFVDAAFICCFGYDLASAMTYQYTGAGSAACSVSAAYYKTNNAWYTTPEVGDQIFFYSSGAINHTGIVVHVGDGAITTVEGNTSDSVARRTYDLNAYNIAGYGRPKWSVVENVDDAAGGDEQPAAPQTPEAPEPPKEEPVTQQMCSFMVELPEIHQGNDGVAVRIAQGLLEARGCTVGWYGIDGDFGPGTEQATRNFQISRNIGVDGIIGQQTWSALLKI